MRPIIGLVLLRVGLSVATVQQPLATSSFGDAATDEYQFDWPIQRVAIIGAGPSGLVAYRELTDAGLDVRIFERDSVPGGNWHYTEEIPHDAPVPNSPTAISDYVPSFPPENVDLPYSEEFEDENADVWRDHRGPKPVWESLTSITASPLQQLPEWPWPAGTPWELSHYQLRNYVRSYASYLNINSNDDNPATAYNTRVEHIEKRVNEAGKEQGWRLWLRSLEPSGRNKYRATWWTEDFDAVAVATGQFNAPSMPSIPGLEEWVQRFPSLIRHSRQYRRPEAYANQTVLIVGASVCRYLKSSLSQEAQVSGSEISRGLNHHARNIYQSFRPDTDSRVHYRLENYMRRIPKNTTLVGEIKRFLPIPEGSPIQFGLVELKNGTILSGIDSVILATGFRYSFPFLSQYYDDLFYIQDPTLAFVGMTSGTQLFSFSEYTTLALAKVWSNTAKLPNSKTMRVLYEKTVEERGGYGKYVLFLGPERRSAILSYLIGWLNTSAAKYGGRQVDGLPKYSKEVGYYFQIAHYGGRLQETIPMDGEALLASF